MSNSFFGVAVDCADAAALARSWAEVLGREVADHPTREHAVVLVDGRGAHGPRLAFHRVPEGNAPEGRVDRARPVIAAPPARSTVGQVATV